MPYAVLDQTLAATAPTTTLGAPLTSVGETLGSISTELLAMLGNRDDLAAGRETSWINKAYRNVAGMLTISEIMGSLPLSFVTGQPFYALPVQVAWIRRLAVQDAVNYLTWQGRPLNQIDLTTYRSLPTLVQGATGANAPPQSYFRHRRMVVIYPSPDNSYVAPLDFRIRPDDMVNTTDSPLLPIEFHNAILLQARVVALSALLNWTDAMKARNDFVSEIKPLLNTDAEETDASYAVVAPVRSRRSLFRQDHD